MGVKDVLDYIRLRAERVGYYDVEKKEVENVAPGSYAERHELRHAWQDEQGIPFWHDVLLPVCLGGGLAAFALGQDWFWLPLAFQFSMYVTMEVDAWKWARKK